ncbi:Protein of unknown function [Lactobacillus equicursoris DSM 19284 = JCM 14600 = CIP 110162]|nr:Protein of unknown function [Lactobacillus equicursoris DSM 19284 = JCM 14600 = CIP 110162]
MPVVYNVNLFVLSVKENRAKLKKSIDNINVANKELVHKI